MGTRSLTHVKDGDTTLVTIYRQFDGYPSGQGSDIVDALAGRKLVNGIPMDDGRYTNGMGDCAAQLLFALKAKHEVGEIYVLEPDASGCGEKYTYTLRGNSMRPKAGITLLVSAYGETIYDGPLSEYQPTDA